MPYCILRCPRCESAAYPTVVGERWETRVVAIDTTNTENSITALPIALATVKKWMSERAGVADMAWGPQGKHTTAGWVLGDTDSIILVCRTRKERHGETRYFVPISYRLRSHNSVAASAEGRAEGGFWDGRAHNQTVSGGYGRAGDGNVHAERLPIRYGRC